MISTHLDVHDLKKYKEIDFFYPEVVLEEDEIIFTYQMKSGISKITLGEKLFNRAGILELL